MAAEVLRSEFLCNLTGFVAPPRDLGPYAGVCGGASRSAGPDRCGMRNHVCVLQTVLGLISAGRGVYGVRDAMGSRCTESKETALRRMERNGAEIVTTEMVLFEWLCTAEDPRLRRVIDMIR
jgi:Isochorismatase family